jgi:predicted DNA-binding transcriptional regulator YafY
MALEDIYIGIEEKRMLKFHYINQRGEESDRTVEPYSVSEGHFFGYDVQKDQIRCFFLAMMSSVELLETRFIPRF